ncbi:BspA family leucine-rich repeat surface protein [Flavobacterium sp. LHD-85]|uniref:BspA family leucine-rich repeat surface protein n=1 Tax=Flavobacterium sp. LHD-85 TaxID=3071410 RepID=UPI0027E1AABC|nr:BspA family leucine-rich repeat surface protein [Flavobacterium sp. LHD-85]MDQ6531278.1 BspA family leucine-rich repeat surface protein [Flavobacterium sp. LHD-85]
MNPLLHYEYGKQRKAFVSTWRTSNISSGSTTSNQIKLPLTSNGNYNFRVDWGDGNVDKITSWNQSQVTHTYSVEGNYTVKITGICNGWSFTNTGDRLKILSIVSWGGLKLGTYQGSFFAGCANLNLSTVSDALDLTGIVTFNSFFYGCTSLTSVSKINEWNTSNIYNMGAMFLGAENFNQNIGAWNVNNVRDFSNMFANAKLFNNGESPDINNWKLKSDEEVLVYGMFSQALNFNQPIGNWNVSSVKSMQTMFQSAKNFNQNIGSWNTANVTSMNYMFSGSESFNQNIGAWNTGKVTDMNNMFTGAYNFNQNIGSWNVTNVISFKQMFGSANSFNNGGSPDINNWTLKPSGAIDMSQMFSGATGFNQPIGNWNTSAVTNMVNMFAYASNFDQNINTWDISKISSLNGMFLGAAKFNQNIGAWNVSNVTDFSIMFQYAYAFNNGGSPDINNWTLKSNGNIDMSRMFFLTTNFDQPIGNWNISNVTKISDFMASNLSPSNLDAIYNGWSSRVVKPSLSISFNSSKYTSASTVARAILTGAPNNWTIYDGGVTT